MISCFAFGPMPKQCRHLFLFHSFVVWAFSPSEWFEFRRTRVACDIMYSCVFPPHLRVYPTQIRIKIRETVFF